MSRVAPPTADELSAAFNDLIDNEPPDGMPTDTGLDDQTVAAIQRVWSAGPRPSAALIEAARQELALQLDGTHAREAQASQDAVVGQVLAAHRAQPITPPRS